MRDKFVKKGKWIKRVRDHGTRNYRSLLAQTHIRAADRINHDAKQNEKKNYKNERLIKDKRDQRENRKERKSVRRMIKGKETSTRTEMKVVNDTERETEK